MDGQEVFEEIQEEVREIRKHLNGVKDVIGGNKIGEYHEIKPALENYIQIFKTTYQCVFELNRPVDDAMSDLKNSVTYTDLHLAHKDLKMLCKKLKNDDNHEESSVHILQKFINHHHVKDKRHICKKIIHILHHMNEYVGLIQGFNHKFYRELLRLHFQKSRIQHHEISEKTRVFIGAQYKIAKMRYWKINVYRKTVIEKYGNLEVEELHNEKLLVHLKELLDMVSD